MRFIDAARVGAVLAAKGGSHFQDFAHPTDGALHADGAEGNAGHADGSACHHEVVDVPRIQAVAGNRVGLELDEAVLRLEGLAGAPGRNGHGVDDEEGQEVAEDDPAEQPVVFEDAQVHRGGGSDPFADELARAEAAWR